jgi:dephospho-CoA kinase
MAAQASDEARRGMATWVIDNGDGLDALERQVADVWHQLEARQEAAGAAEPGS